jgi:ElaB/YqjD/DUF883 family membrane-anchored ribosome-binding protein
MTMEGSRQSSGNAWPQAGGSTNTRGQGAQSRTEALKDKVGEEFDRGKSNVADSASAAGENLSEDLARLRDDMARMQETVSKFASEAGSEAYKTAQNVGSAVASQVGEVASEVASTAKSQMKTFASELETMARNNPLGTIGATLLVGVVIGMMSRGRS